MNQRTAMILNSTTATAACAIALLATPVAAWCVDTVFEERTLQSSQQLDAASLSMGRSVDAEQDSNLDAHRRLQMQQLELDQRMQQQQLMQQQMQETQRTQRIFDSQPGSVRNAQSVAEQRRFDRERQQQLQQFEFERQYQLQQFRASP